MTFRAWRRCAVVLQLALTAALLSCRGCGTDVDPLDADFRVDPSTQSLEFGRVLEGQQVTKTVLLFAETRAALTVTASVGRPFSAPMTVDIPGGGMAEVPVTFTAGNGEATGTLVLSAPSRTVEVSLHGIGVRPPVCTPSAPCRESTYDLVLDQCVETISPDDTACDPGNICLEQGRCRAGMCLGVPRTCDDNNACTNDGCSMTSGCVNSPRTCPAPADPCKVAACDPLSGCGEANALDGTVCGDVDCVSGHFCLAGGCVTLPTPDGFLCGAAIACIPEARCRNQVCTRPDAGQWLPRWSARVPGQPSTEAPSLLASAGNVFFSTCGVPRPVLDGGADGGSDGGDDAGLDGGGADGGEDAGLLDGGFEDGGLDAGPGDDGGVCALASWTSSGFDRFVTPYETDGARRLLNLSPRGALLARDGGLELRSLADGTLKDAVDAVPVPGGVAVSPDAGLVLWLADGTVAHWGDAGLVPVLALGGAGVLALDTAGALYTWEPDAGVLSRVTDEGDGGLALTAVRVDAGLSSVVVASDHVVVGGRQQVRWLSDGGTDFVDLSWFSDAGVLLEAEPRGVLASTDSVVIFARQCVSPLMSCLRVDQELWARVTDLRTGAVRWQAKVLPAGIESRLEEAALVNFMPGTVATLVKADFSGLDAGYGLGAYLQVFAEGRRAVLCPLPVESSDVRGALFAAGSLFVLSNEGDSGVVVLEAYELKGLPLSYSGWPQADGVEGMRRALP
ncbi:MAG: hypothetical protein AB1938_30580 [Myxococcota bacterium]